MILIYVLNKHELSLLLVKVMQKNYLDLFIMIFGVHIEFLHFMALNIFFTIVNDASRAVWVYLMREKGEASLLLQDFVIMVKTQFGRDVKIVRSDNGLQFFSRPMKQFY